MSDDEGFLARWSRRKRAAAAQADARETAPPSAVANKQPAASAIPDEPAAIRLPTIESIHSASDVTTFLAAGVPLELTRAALRRAWTVDPAIRDFIGLSENAWDFTAPDGVPGFGSLDPDQVRRLVEEVLGEPKATAPTNSPAMTADSQAPPPADTTMPAALAADESPGSIAAVQYEKDETKPCESGSPRRHGGALPQ